MKIYTATEIKQVESHAFEHEPIQPIDLMERAASTICEEIKSKWGTETSIKVFAGSHNNGGDALAVSRMLAQCGYNLEVFLFNTNGHLTPECEINRDRLVATCPQVTFHEISTKIDLPKITKDDLIIDGLFGVGLNGSINGSYTLLIKFLNNSEGTIISIDIPSGMHCEDNSQTLSHQIVHADYTFPYTL
jgi:NAD(P)H-hydrate epimerase